MPPPGREVQAERPGTLPAYRVRCKPLLGSTRQSSSRIGCANRVAPGAIG
jgi:hypothetical protein